ncbi:diaminopimelate epimerase [Desulfacinum hydrothermale DSM 13146]|uniref:Diaminopimelate epimerase n=1 Tax=Desulfacinum hydrothermale DSM 13146 TaxID=1121390 RepID=A0A1W1X9F9_9BACT|nr:diaminopimelate epimerase [Desulfacinum hydrothermale]SMC20151.1 diaminopimelate epimerase [Desulfacinum hydrothermale DSM 13146]
MEPILFYKMTGSGNDFVVIDNRSGSFCADAPKCRDFVVQVCRRKLSVGADGVIFIENDPECDFRWRFFNADGSEAEMCGNGARCAARFAFLTGIVTERDLRFRTLAGIIRAHVDGRRVKVQMTDPFDFQGAIPLEAAGRSVTVDFINTGVPHAVCFLPQEPELEQLDVAGMGRAVRYHERFQPAGTNANFVAVLGRDRLRIRTYERGVEDETLACGTGSIAAALTAHERGLVDVPVRVVTQGGETLTIHFDRMGPGEYRNVFLEGEARVAYEGRLWQETL